MDFGPIEHNGPKPREQRLSVTAAGQVQVAGSEHWIIPMPSTLMGSGTVAVSVEPTRLTLATVSWRAPDLVRPVMALIRRIGNQAWWLALMVFLIAAGTSGGRQALALIVGGWLGLHVTLWVAARLLGRLGYRPAELRGQLIVTTGSTGTALDVRVKVVPSRRDMVLGWGGAVLVVGTLVMSVVAGLMWLMSKL